MNVFKEDIRKIGHTHYEENGNLIILGNINTGNIEEILLREILKEIGHNPSEYKIISRNVIKKDGEYNTIFITNLPWIFFNNLHLA